MASKRILGNDPFKRGAAPRVPLQNPPSSSVATDRVPVTPELLVASPQSSAVSEPPPEALRTAVAVPPVVRTAKRPSTNEEATLRSKPPPAADPPRAAPVPTKTTNASEPAREQPHVLSHSEHPKPPKFARKRSTSTSRPSEDPQGPGSHGTQPTVEAPASRGPTAHASSPAIEADPVRHHTSPLGETLAQRQPAAHASSPVIDTDPIAHRTSPLGEELAPHHPAAHASSPALESDPVSHLTSPLGQPLAHHQPAAHASSPQIAADPIRHDRSPMGEPLSLRQPAAHQASPASVADPLHQAGAQPTVVSSSAAIFSQAAAAAASIASPEQLDVPSTVSIAGATEKKQPAHEALDADDLAATQTHSVSMLSAEGAAASVRGFRALVRTLVGRATPDTRVDRFGRDESLVNSLQPLADLLYERYWRVTVEGANQIPNSPCIFVANHAGALPIDGPLLHHALRRQRPDLKATRWLLEDQVFHTPGLGLLWNRLGAVRASPENAHALLQEKTPIIVFPEGFQGLSKPFSERYQLRRFGRGGYVKIAVRAQVPIVPVAIVGAEDAVPLLAKLPGGLFGLPYLPITIPPLPAKWVIRFGEPVWLNAGPDAANDIDWVLQTNDRLRTHIDSMLQELLSQRSSVF